MMQIAQDKAHPQMLLGEDHRCVAMCRSTQTAEAIRRAVNVLDNSRELMRPAVDVIFDKFDSLTRDQALEMLVDALDKTGAA